MILLTITVKESLKKPNARLIVECAIYIISRWKPIFLYLEYYTSDMSVRKQRMKSIEFVHHNNYYALYVLASLPLSLALFDVWDNTCPLCESLSEVFAHPWNIRKMFYKRKPKPIPIP